MVKQVRVVAAPALRRKSELRKEVVGVRYYLQRVGALAKACRVAYYARFPSTHLLPRGSERLLTLRKKPSRERR